MPSKGKISNENGQLSIDFIIGFTIFMISFIFIATMISGLLINLQSRTIDYDAVAYRTGVVMVEDPGEFGSKGEPYYWQLLDLSKVDELNQLERLGLAIDRNSPGIIRMNKIEKFFTPVTSGCTVPRGENRLCYPSDFTQKLIFGDYPYSFNISLKELNGTNSRVWYLGENPPDKYGYIRRAVGIKNPGFAEINTTNSTYDSISLFINMYELNAPSIPPAYQMKPYEENTTVFLKNVTIPGTHLSYLDVYQGSTPLNIHGESPTVWIYVNDTRYNAEYDVPVEINNYTKIVIDEGYFRRESVGENDVIELRMAFDQFVSDGFPLKIQDSSIIPPLTWAIMEIKIW